MQPDFDVIIVGGRPAGASLAARLGQQKIKTLIVDRATFPSPHPVSSPFALPHTLALLDEIGANESDYARNTPRMHRFVLEFKNFFRAFFPVTEQGGRNYIYTVERGRFDDCLWRNLQKYPSVTALQNFSVVDLVWDESGRVVGIQGRRPKQARQTYTARCVVGADGRYSTVAQKAGAPVTEKRTDVDTTIYYAYWENVAPYDEQGDALPHIHTAVNGFSFVFMPTADNLVSVVAQGQSDLYNPSQGQVQEEYLRLLKAQPYVWRWLTQAKQVTQLSGMKRMGNLFRQPAGAGWALVGDAYHQKDSLDAQGIYDALLGAKYLAEELTAWHQGDKPLEDALTRYGNRAYAALKPMFDSTMDRVKREIHTIPPPFVSKSILRWILTSQEYQRRFSALLVRQIEPKNLMSPPAVVRMILSGLATDIKRGFVSNANPNVMPPDLRMRQN